MLFLIFISPVCIFVWHILHTSIKFSFVSFPPEPFVFMWCFSVCPFLPHISHIPFFILQKFFIFYSFFFRYWIK
nr:MAG TPA: hypothetical protein [Caudoviricetes sp.]DAT04997.1 MAG TPA: hypothetical protein [Caudoviricetes sp.]